MHRVKVGWPRPTGAPDFLRGSTNRWVERSMDRSGANHQDDRL